MSCMSGMALPIIKLGLYDDDSTPERLHPIHLIASLCVESSARALVFGNMQKYFVQALD